MASELATATIETIYAAHKAFLEQFWAAGGPRRELISLEKFSAWWGTLTEPQRTNYLNQYEVGYQEFVQQASGVDLEKMLNDPSKAFDPELMTLVESCHQKPISNEEQVL